MNTCLRCGDDRIYNGVCRSCGYSLKRHAEQIIQEASESAEDFFGETSEEDKLTLEEYEKLLEEEVRKDAENGKE